MQTVMAFSWKYAHVDDDTLVADYSCVLHSIVINHADSAVTTATVYDGEDNTGDVVAVIDLDIGKDYHVLPVTLLYDIRLSSGCYVEFSNAPATADLTVSYY
jgi:hypothetical protein